MRHLDLFSGIGGFALATEMVWPKVEHEFVEWDPFCQAVLKKHWSQSKIHGDIKTYRGGSGPIDLLTGGFPCQPFSAAGKRKGTEDDRHLWPEMLRVIREVRPRWVIGENVGGIITWERGMVVEQVFTDLEGAGYQTQPFIIPAAGVGAPHRRDRIWFVGFDTECVGERSEKGGGVERDVFQEGQREESADTPRGSSGDASDSVRFIAHASSTRHGREPRDVRKEERRPKSGKGGVGGRTDQILNPDTDTRGVQRHERSRVEERAVTRSSSAWDEDWPSVAARLCRVDDGIPKRVDRLKALGNAIVPQVAAEIMRAIKEVDNTV